MLKEPYPKGYKIPRVTSFNGTIDLVDHINRFLHQVESQTTRDDILCRAFPGTLEGVLYRWFSDLKLGSITSFGDLCQKFMAQHVAKMKVKK